MHRTQFSTRSNGLFWPELIPGVLVKRYKRFMADVELKNGQVVTAHCPNSGSMKACCEPGRPVYLSHHDDPKRKLKYTWELIEMPTSLVGVNTLIPNHLVYQAIQDGQIEALNGYENMHREIKINSRTRLDILLSNGENDRCFIEIKNCTLVSDTVACFPDAVTSRGLKHLQELRSLIADGVRGVIFFLIQRGYSSSLPCTGYSDSGVPCKLFGGLRKNALDFVNR